MSNVDSFYKGTTGNPKGSVLSHHNLVNNAFFIGLRQQYDTLCPKICIPVPLYHCFGSVAGVLSGTQFGCSLILPSAGFNPKAIMQSFKKEKPNSCYGTPTMFVDIIDEFRKDPCDMSSFYSGIMAGAPCPEHLVNALMKELNMTKFIVSL